MLFCYTYEEGPYRTYVRFENNDSNLRGTVDIARHIKLNATMNNGKIAYSYRELTADNPINCLILHTYHYAKRLYPDVVGRLQPEVEQAIQSLEWMTESFDRLSVDNVIAKCNRVISHPFYCKYEELRKTCLNFLQYMGLSFFDGDEDDEVQGVLFYAPDLWEEYLENCFLNHNMSFEAQFDVPICIDVNKEPDKNTSGETHAYPDYVFFDGNRPIMVLDAKYKIGWSRGGFDLGDFTKCIRDMNATYTHKTGVIYPVKDEEETSKKEQYISYYNTEDKFYRIPVTIPNVNNEKSYAQWVEELNQNVISTIEIIKSIL